jgi:hypothetical protein
MYTFSPSFTPALRGHIGAQLSFADDLSRSMLSSFEKLCSLNMQAIRALVEAASTTRPQRWSDMQANLAAFPAIATKPAIEKIHAYQQNVSRLAVDAQIEMAQVMQEHSTITPRTARTLSEEVVRSASEEMERGVRRGQESLVSLAEPFSQTSDGMNEEVDDSADDPEQTEHIDTF